MKSSQSDGEIEKASGFSIRMIGAAAGVIAGLGTIYHFVLSPESNLIGTSGFGIALFSLLWIAYSVYLAARGKHGKWKPQSLAVPIALLAVSPLLFLWSRSLGPDIGAISVADEDDEQLVLTGRRFGKNLNNLKVLFDGKEQTPLSLSDSGLKVAIPPSFQKGNIAVRRGPRTSASKYFSFPGVSFDAIVVNMFRPSPMDSLIYSVGETCPHFPWYSYESDHFSFWPPRHSKECRELVTVVHSMFEGDAGRELSNWERSHPSTETAVGKGADQRQARFRSLRSYFRNRDSDAGVLRRLVGPNVARLMEKAETMFWGMNDEFPNRLLLLKIRNEQNVDAENIEININVKNDIYDALVDMFEDQAAMAAQLEKNLTLVQNVLNLTLPRLRPGNEAEVKVWYDYQPPGFFTNDAVDAQWKHREGILVNNIGATNLHFKRNKHVYEKFQADSLIPVDPVKPRSKTSPN